MIHLETSRKSNFSWNGRAASDEAGLVGHQGRAGWLADTGSDVIT
jgi:hypothetical protein